MYELVVEVLQEADVLPDHYQFPRPVPDPGGCWTYGEDGYGVTVLTFATHTWDPANIGAESSTWFCSRCRRVERRTMVPIPEDDLTITESFELDVAQVEGNTEAGIDFVDRWLPSLVGKGGRMIVVDAGRIILPREDVSHFRATAAQCGLTTESQLVFNEESGATE